MIGYNLQSSNSYKQSKIVSQKHIIIRDFMCSQMRCIIYRRAILINTVEDGILETLPISHGYNTVGPELMLVWVSCMEFMNSVVNFQLDSFGPRHRSQCIVKL